MEIGSRKILLLLIFLDLYEVIVFSLDLDFFFLRVGVVVGGVREIVGVVLMGCLIGGGCGFLF